jgi:hypothetical protein
MSKTLILRDEIFEYPDTGDINYGEEATGWAEEATDILGEVSGPGDIPTTEVSLVGTDNGTHIEGIITNLVFDTSFVQSMQITGFLTRTYTDATPTEVEAFTIEGAYNGTVINFSPDYAGDDVDLEFTVSGGQFGFIYLKKANTDTVTIKYSAKAKIDESFFP